MMTPIVKVKMRSLSNRSQANLMTSQHVITLSPIMVEPYRKQSVTLWIKKATLILCKKTKRDLGKELPNKIYD